MAPLARTNSHSAAQIVPSSLRLRRLDGTGPTLKLGAFQRQLVDITRPHVGFQGGCTSASGEGHTDLVIDLPSLALMRALGLRSGGAPSWVDVELSGLRIDGSSFSARDLVLVP